MVDLRPERGCLMSLNEDAKLVEVCRAADNLQAQMIRGLLETNGIACMISGEAVSRIYGIRVNGLGEVPVLVREEDAERATAILRECDSDVLP